MKIAPCVFAPLRSLRNNQCRIENSVVQVCDATGDEQCCKCSLI